MQLTSARESSGDGCLRHSDRARQSGSDADSKPEPSSANKDRTSCPEKHESLSTETVPDTKPNQFHQDQDPDNTHEHSSNPYDEAFPDRPIQLIRPDPAHHRRLELIERNVKHLHHINTAVAVVAVVGKFHSGKSFLLNQLMGKKNGFGVGPSVRPQTMGIWMWGKVVTSYFK